ncbi:[protein-PII] uridylyltransferase [Streptomyces kronopolitis]|uniref:[protein-PII] uridylyltransferase n=1 Tax=Streptomyces kronopolitis TaxID=1612435 RepID=UPI003D978E0E
MTDSVEETAGPAGTPDSGGEPAPVAAGGYPAARLRLLRDDAPAGPDRRAALARLTDDWLAGLLTRHAPAAGLTGTALVAVGGYGRGELSPRSDLDLLLLHDGRADTGALAALADHLWYPVWDLGLDLDHSVRTPAEARKAARDDLKVQLGLLDARHLAGDAELTAALRSTAYADWRESAPKRLPELHDLCQERAERHGELQFLLEPDLKEARGGLRDATALRAVAASWLADAPRGGLEAARTRLLDTRDALHLATGRATDRLSLQEHTQVAESLGVLDADALLRQTYESARTISYAADVTWREVGRVLRARSVKPVLRGLLHGRAAGKGERSPLAEGVVELDGEAVLARTARPERDPVLVLRAAAAAAQAGLPLATAAIRRCATAAATRPLPVPWPAEAREQLITLLGAGAHTVPVWEALEAEGLVTRLLPDWERVRCRPQRNPVHTWTVDRHLIEAAVRASALTRRVHRPDLLLIAALLHDIGKGWPGDHSVAGETIARDVAARLGFGARDTEVIATLVRHHLLLIDTATRRDLDDPATVGAVAEAVGHTGTLELLHALTEADALATGPAAWSAWRGGLVADLVKRVAARLAGEPAEEARPADGPTDEQRRLAAEARRTDGPVLALHARADPPAGPGDDSVEGERARQPVGVELLMAVPAHPSRGHRPSANPMGPPSTGVLPAAAGVLALHRLTVRAADLLELDSEDGDGDGDPILLIGWRVAAEFGSLPDADRLRVDLVRALEGSLDIPTRLAERERAYARRARAVLAPPPRVTAVTGSSRTATVIEVRAQDAHGLLHRIGRALETAGVTVRSAHISTLGANAVDAFYVTGPDGEPLTDTAAHELAAAVQRALG